MSPSLRLEHVADVKVLQEIQDSFCEATGVAALVSDSRGKPLTSISNFSAFCRGMRSDPAGRQMCEEADYRAGKIARTLGQPYLYRCHAGLVDVATPIVVNHHHLGSMLTGQVVLESTREMESLPQILPSGIAWEQDPQMVKHFRLLKRISLRRMRAVARSLATMAKYLVERGMTAVIQEKLHQQELSLIEERRLRAELESSLKETELMALQAQINPHFLFNSLNTISRLIALETPQQTQNMVHNLARLLRYSLRNSNQIVTLGEELEQVRRYLYIQKVRFGERVEARIQVPANLCSLEIPVFTLQPLVENCIVHGLEPKKGPGLISIEAAIRQRQVSLKVADNGVGMDRETLDRITPGSERNPAVFDRDKPNTGLGVNNVHIRLQYYFGTDYRMEISSKIDHGTIFTLKLPFREGEAL